jgi:hypothetical protein
MAYPGDDVQDHPDRQQARLHDDKAPGTDDSGDPVGSLLAEGRLSGYHLINVLDRPVFVLERFGKVEGHGQTSLTAL